MERCFCAGRIRCSVSQKSASRRTKLGYTENVKHMDRLIEIDPRRCNGKPVVEGTRIPVTAILDQLAESGSVDAVLQRYPELTAEMVTAALHYSREVIERTEL